MMQFVEGDGFHSIKTRYFEAIIEPLVSHGDGRFVAILFKRGEQLQLDKYSWPRYYFDLEVAKSEVIAWLKENGEA